MIARPDNLPEYDSPPLDEVVLGVQFAPPASYTSVYAKDVWELFQANYPNVQEQPAIEPTFETFGSQLAGIRLGPAIKFHIPMVSSRMRLWFVSSDETHLVQFQSDRLLLNWRRRQDANPYPRFETFVDSFYECARKLEAFYNDKFDHELVINQAEISYINIINVDKYSEASKWLSYLQCNSENLESINNQMSEVVSSDSGSPFARLSVDLQSVVTTDPRATPSKAFRLSITFRGKPDGADIEHALVFLRKGRELIVNKFTELTTESAHRAWGRSK